MINEHDFENKPFAAALAQMRESELARLLDMVESLAQDFRLIPLRKSESAAAVATAQRLLKIWNDEAKRILKIKRMKDAAQLG